MASNTDRAAKATIDSERLNHSVQSFGRIGALPEGGVCRLALTDSDRAGRDELVSRMHALGLTIQIDSIGNIFGTRAGCDRDAGTVMIGSHIDTVSTGGLYDGTFGVLAGLEVIAALNDIDVETRCSVTVAAFTNEEGARFQPDMLGSLVFVGGLPLQDALDTTDATGVQLGAELERINYKGLDTGPQNIAAYFELHIEQGPILEAENIQIGVVSGVQGISWHEFSVQGRSAHAGTTPMAMRADAGFAACLIAQRAHHMARDIGADQLITVGSLRVTPDLVNVVAEKAILTVDLRNPDGIALAQADDGLIQIARAIAAETGTCVTHRSLARFDPVAFDEALVEEVESVAQELGYSTRRLHSGAGHDAQMIARKAPSAMIFVPSAGGISHNIREFTPLADLVRGATVLSNLVVKHAQMIQE